MKTPQRVLLIAFIAMFGLLALQYETTAASRLLPFQDRLADAIADGLCDRQAKSSAQYPRLYVAIATHWGYGNPPRTNDFNLPDLLRGVDSSPNSDRDRDQANVINPTGGSESRPKNAYVNYIIK